MSKPTAELKAQIYWRLMQRYRAALEKIEREGWREAQGIKSVYKMREIAHEALMNDQ